MTKNCALAGGILLCLLTCLLSGCAVGNKYAYDNVTGRLLAGGETTIAVAVHDQRPYVVSGEKKPVYIGEQRGGFGNPFDVETASQRPMAEDMCKAIVAALSGSGFRVTPVVVSATTPADQLVQQLVSTQAAKLVVLTLLEWYSDTASNIGMNYEVKLSVYDAAGKLLAETSAKGEDTVEGSAWNPPKVAKVKVPQFFMSKMEELFNRDAIKKALEG